MGRGWRKQKIIRKNQKSLFLIVDNMIISGDRLDAIYNEGAGPSPVCYILLDETSVFW